MRYIGRYALGGIRLWGVEARGAKQSKKRTAGAPEVNMLFLPVRLPPSWLRNLRQSSGDGRGNLGTVGGSGERHASMS